MASGLLLCVRFVPAALDGIAVRLDRLVVQVAIDHRLEVVDLGLCGLGQDRHLEFGLLTRRPLLELGELLGVLVAGREAREFLDGLLESRPSPRPRAGPSFGPRAGRATRSGRRPRREASRPRLRGRRICSGGRRGSVRSSELSPGMIGNSRTGSTLPASRRRITSPSANPGFSTIRPPRSVIPSSRVAPLGTGRAGQRIAGRRGSCPWMSRTAVATDSCPA